MSQSRASSRVAAQSSRSDISHIYNGSAVYKCRKWPLFWAVDAFSIDGGSRYIAFSVTSLLQNKGLFTFHQ